VSKPHISQTKLNGEGFSYNYVEHALTLES